MRTFKNGIEVAHDKKSLVGCGSLWGVLVKSSLSPCYYNSVDSQPQPLAIFSHESDATSYARYISGKIFTEYVVLNVKVERI